MSSDLTLILFFATFRMVHSGTADIRLYPVIFKNSIISGFREFTMPCHSQKLKLNNVIFSLIKQQETVLAEHLLWVSLFVWAVAEEVHS